jgi:hypothetical protein
MRSVHPNLWARISLFKACRGFFPHTCITYNIGRFPTYSILNIIFPKTNFSVSLSTFSPYLTFLTAKMDAYSISYTTPSRRGTSRIYQDLDACRTSNRNYTDERIQKLIMDGSQKVSSGFPRNKSSESLDMVDTCFHGCLTESISLLCVTFGTTVVAYHTV